MDNDINELSAEEAYAIVNAVKIVMDAIKGGHLDVRDPDEFYRLLESSHRKLTDNGNDADPRPAEQISYQH